MPCKFHIIYSLMSFSLQSRFQVLNLGIYSLTTVATQITGQLKKPNNCRNRLSGNELSIYIYGLTRLILNSDENHTSNSSPEPGIYFGSRSRAKENTRLRRRIACMVFITIENE